MIDENLPELIKSASDAVQANLPETAKETDGALSTVVGFFNNVVLYPLKKANISFKYKLEEFQADLERKIIDVPNENLQAPPIMIAGPTLEALRYAYDEEELRELYENLLATSMDTRVSSNAHPAYVDTIRQMSPLDARVMREIVLRNSLGGVSIKFNIKNEKRTYFTGMPDYYVPDLKSLGDPFEISASLANLSRLCLIEITPGTISGFDYDSIENDDYVNDRLKTFKKFGKEIEKQSMRYAIGLNFYGLKFASVCLKTEAKQYYAD